MANPRRGTTIEIRGDEVAAPLPIYRDRIAHWVKVWSYLGPAMGLDRFRLVYNGEEIARFDRGRQEADAAPEDGTRAGAYSAAMAQARYVYDAYGWCIRGPLQRQTGHKD
jgi:hypothetical protein